MGKIVVYGGIRYANSCKAPHMLHDVNFYVLRSSSSNSRTLVIS